VIAPLVGVLRAPSDAGAQIFYGIVTRQVPPGYSVSHPALGEEATLATSPAGGPPASYAFIREHNVVVEWSLISTPGNDEAGPENSLALMHAVAAKL
jgi:hypothetical protein